MEEWYPVVGVLEELRDTLRAVEEAMPTFFRGVVKLYDDSLKSSYMQTLYFNKVFFADVALYVYPPASRKNHGIKHKELSLLSRATLLRNLTLETEFFEWARQRLATQIEQL